MKALPAVFLVAALALAGCQREERRPSGATPARGDEAVVALTDLSPGGTPPVRAASPVGEEFAGDPARIGAGRELFSSFNCVGCHANGGGGSGPALMDGTWIYGSSMDNIAASIRNGRPNGMPAFRGRIDEEGIWELAAYVHSLAK